MLFCCCSEDDGDDDYDVGGHYQCHQNVSAGGLRKTQTMTVMVNTARAKTIITLRCSYPPFSSLNAFFFSCYHFTSWKHWGLPLAFLVCLLRVYLALL